VTQFPRGGRPMLTVGNACALLNGRAVNTYSINCQYRIVRIQTILGKWSLQMQGWMRPCVRMHFFRSVRSYTHKNDLQKHAQVTGRFDVSKDGATANPCTVTAIMTPLNARTIALRERTMVVALCVKRSRPGPCPAFSKLSRSRNGSRLRARPARG
jgi:hypothetical protein